VILRDAAAVLALGATWIAVAQHVPFVVGAASLVS
jgi:hypothetical protein